MSFQLSYFASNLRSKAILGPFFPLLHISSLLSLYLQYLVPYPGWSADEPPGY